MTHSPVQREAPSEAAKADDTYHAYQIENLLGELGYTQLLANSLAWKFCSLPSVQFLSRHIQQFYWTVTRLAGLAHLHDGSGSKSRVRPLLEGIEIAPASGPRILIDVTLTYRNDIGTGIQ